MEKYLSQAPLKGMTQRDSEVIFDNNKLRSEAAMLEDEVDALKDLKDPESQRQYNIKKKKLEALNKLGEKTAKFSNYFNRYENASAIRAQLQKQKGDVPVTDEEVEQVLNEQFGELNDENKVRVTSEHEAAYKDYLKVLADVNGDYLFDQSIDESYELLADHFKLGADAKSLMKYVNLLHDPQGFIENVTRTQKWMRSLYNRRGEIYEKMIKEQLDIVIDNSLLNELANKGVYISLDEFADWQKNGTPPSEFFDYAKKLIIPEGTEEYEKYYQLFEQAAELKDKPTGTVKESLDNTLREELEKIDADMAAAIEKVPKKEVRVPVETLTAKDGVKITLAKIANTLKPGEYAESTFDEEAESKLVFYKDEAGEIRLDGPEGDTFKDLKIAVDFIKADIYTLSEQADPELVAPIKERFQILKNQKREEYADKVEQLKKEEEGPIKDFVPITNTVESISDYPVLYNTLYKSFEEKVLSKMSDEDAVNLTEDQEINLFNKFLQTDKESKIVIDDFNKNQKLQETTKETGEKGEFEYMYQGNKKNTADIKTVLELRKAQRRFKALIQEIETKENPTAEDMTNKSKYKILVTDFEKLIATRSRKGLTPELQAAIAKIDAIKEKQGDVVITEEGVTVNGQEYQTANKALGIEEVKSPFKEYLDEQVKNLFDIEATPTFDETKITREAYDSLFGPEGYLTKLRQRVDNGELFIVSQGLTVYDTKSKVASTIDLLVADANSNLTIVAVTPDSKSNWDTFKKKDNPKSKMKDAEMLQTANANLLKSMIGEDAKIAVLPIEMSVTTTDNKILSANKPSTTSLLATDFLIGLSKVDAQAEIDKLIPLEKPAVVSEANVVPKNAESSDDVPSPAVEAGQKEREVTVIDDAVRYRVSDFKTDLGKITTKEELKALVADLSIKNAEQLISFEDLKEMSELIKEKSEQLNTPQEMKLVPESLATGTELVAKNTIFTSNINVQVDETVVVKSVNTSNKTIIVTPLNSSSSITLSFSELNKSFTLKDAIMNATETGEQKVTPEDQTKINKSTDLVDTFVQNKTGRIDQIEETASAKSIKELDEELMEDLEC